ncbi:zinc ribbon domain-containing protein [Thiothrix nivea]|uniref:Zinc-ribbon domain-containing protein n=1 Tax=Thiothrix nivea (strain ATCC 35100 / DSM 5205 / JP2) TaxID=870187 RepID=A0A656HJ79_THINJ|nr:zinc ribbon domain-containing protein [Thiothrix nivea]EIJ36978.1 hypothetical protein Thini_4504 [Thiothrix nivea DSM 5205]
MALTKCKKCGTEISTKAKECPKCAAPQGPKQYNVAILIFPLIIGWLLYSFFTTDHTSSSTNSSGFRGAEFSTLEQCMTGLQKELGAKLRVIIDEPEEVTGSQADGTFWACEKKSTGTKGIYWEGYYKAK